MSGAEERSPLVAVANPGLSSQAASPRPSTQVGDATTPITTTTTTTTTQCVDATAPITATTTPTTQVAGATTPITATTTTTQASGSKNAAVRVYDQSSKKAKAAPKSGWKPFTMEAPFLGVMIVLSLGLAGVIEYLAQVSARNGGLALSPSEDDIPYAVNLAYLYLPTTIAVAYSLLWTCVDVDVRRMQPWLELSRPGGARGDQSLLLDYPFEFLPLLPVSAGKRRQWPVAIVGLVMMSVFWVITPLQGAIFGKQSVVLDKNTTMSVRSGLVPVEEQAGLLDSSILNAAYVSMWFSEEVPDYTTTEYALLPYSPSASTTMGTSETWRANTTKYATELDCWPATYDWNATGLGGMFRFDNGQGCTYETSFSLGERAVCAQYMGYYQDDYLDWTSLRSDSCGVEFSHQFLAFTAEGMGNSSNGTFGNITALFCETSYTQQEVSIVVDAATGQPLQDTLIELGAATNLTDAVFNATAFEFLLYAGFPMLSVPRDYPDDLVLQPEATVSDLNISFPISNMVGFFFGMYNGSLSDLLNATSIHETYSAAHQLIFSYAISQLLSEDTDTDTTYGVIEYTLNGIVVSRPFAIAVECTLAIVAILGGLMLYTIMVSKSNLEGDPDSTASLLVKIQGEESILSNMSGKDGVDEASLRTSVAKNYYALQRSDVTGQPKIRLLSPGTTSDDDDSDADENTPANGSAAQAASVQPKELRPAIGMLLMLVLLAALGVLAYFKHQEMALNGLTRPTQNFLVLQLLENYIPMVYSTLLEPFLTLLNRLLALLQPYYDLQMGKCPARRTIETKYDSMPPQLNIFRAARTGHYVLCLLSLVVLLASVLSVALGAIFNESSVSAGTVLNVTSLKTTALTRDTILPQVMGVYDKTWYYFDHFYMVQTNVSDGAQLPAWIDEQFAYLPFADTTSKDNSSVEYTAVTRGFGIATNCSELSTSNTSAAYVSYNFNNTVTWGGISQQEQTLEVTYADYNYTCNPGSLDATLEMPTTGSSTSAQEIYSYLSSPSTATNQTNFCGQRLLMGWMRYEQDQPTGYQPASVWMECKSDFLTAQFNVTVDADGHILRSERVGSYEDITEVLGGNATAARRLWRDLNMYIGGYGTSTTSSAGADVGWHNDTMTRNWMSYFLKLTTNSTALIDPSAPVPEIASIKTTVEMLYQRIGAALLGANRDIFVDAQTDTTPTISAVMVTSETRIFMDDTAYLISMTILGIYVVAVALFYLRQRSTLLPRMPSTIGSTIAYVAASRAVRVYRGPPSTSTLKTKSGKGAPGETYSFGRYTGLDGKVHFGIELDPYVVPSRQRSSGFWHVLDRWRRSQQQRGRYKAAKK